MVGFLIALFSALPFYSRSRYFPDRYEQLKHRIPRRIGLLLVIIAAGVYVAEWGAAVGLLVWVAVIPAAWSVVVMLFNLPRRWALALILTVFCLSLLTFLI